MHTSGCRAWCFLLRSPKRMLQQRAVGTYLCLKLFWITSMQVSVFSPLFFPSLMIFKDQIKLRDGTCCNCCHCICHGRYKVCVCSSISSQWTDSQDLMDAAKNTGPSWWQLLGNFFLNSESFNSWLKGNDVTNYTAYHQACLPDSCRNILLFWNAVS